MVTIEQYFPADFIARLEADREQKRGASNARPRSNVVSFTDARRALRARLRENDAFGGDAA